MSWKDTYDVSPEQQKIAQWRDMKRRQLRELYLKEAGHPTKSLLFDTGFYRYNAAKASVEMFFVPKAINYITRMGTIIGLIVFTAFQLKKRRDAREHLYRTGQVPYADRNKFL